MTEIKKKITRDVSGFHQAGKRTGYPEDRIVEIIGTEEQKEKKKMKSERA